MFPWAPRIWTHATHTDLAISLLLRSATHQESWIRRGACLAWLHTVALSPSRTQYPVFDLHWHIPLSSLPQLTDCLFEATPLTFHPLDSHLIIRFSPLLLNGRLGGRDCFGWNLTRHRWFTSCKFFSSCWPPTNSWSFHSSFCGGGGGGAVQEGTVSPWCCCSTPAAVSGWHGVWSGPSGRVFFLLNVYSSWGLERAEGTALKWQLGPHPGWSPSSEGPLAIPAHVRPQWCVASTPPLPPPPALDTRPGLAAYPSTPGLVAIQGHQHRLPK